MKMTFKPTVMAFALFAVLPALSSAAGSDATATPQIKARVAEAKAVTQDFLKTLGGTMMKQMKAGGPGAAMDVCRKVAPEIANDISLQKGWKVTRVGTRVRNPMLGTPDAWEQDVLNRFAERAKQGEALKTMAYYEVVEEPNGKYLRFMKAIGVAPKCLICHGDKAQMPEIVRTKLEALYPHDQATGYKPGDLRGAVSIKQPLEM